MSEPSSIAHWLSSHRLRLVVVLAVAATAGAGSYALIAHAPSPAAAVAAAVAATPAARSADAADLDVVQAALRLGKPTVVEFGANACASCREMKPILDALERDHGARISVRTVDIIKARDYASRYRIQLMPTQVYFDAQGREIGRTMGKVTGGEILARLGVATTGRAP